MDTIPEFTPQIAMVLGMVLITLVLFVTEWLRVDVVAILIMIALPLLGLVEASVTFQGLSSTAVVSIIAVMIMGRGLDHAGVISRGIRPILRLAGTSIRRTLVLMSGTVAVVSSIMQNVGAAALFLPAIQRIARKTGTPVSSLLMPIGFSAILGGTISLVGSSPLIMLNDLIEPLGIPPFSLFSVTPAGIAFVATGILYFILAGRYVLPKARSETGEGILSQTDPLVHYPELADVFELEYTPQKAKAGPRVEDLADEYNVHVVALSPDGGKNKMMPPDREISVSPGSVFAAYGSREHVEEAARVFGFHVRENVEVFSEELSKEVSGVVEAIVSPRSPFIGKTVKQVRFRHNHLMTPLALMHQGLIRYTKLSPHLLEPGDIILMHGRWERFKRMRPRRDLLFAQSLERETVHTHKAATAFGCFLLATLLVIFTSLPISVCLMTGALGMILTRVLHIDEAYQSVDWRTVFLLSGLIPLGIAMEQTLAADWLVQHVLLVVERPHPLVFILFLGLVTTVLTLVISNVGATVLLVPLAVDMAVKIGVDPRMAALVVGLAASNSFLLPTHQVNALYMGPGGYGSRDFIRAGAPLSVLFLLVLVAVTQFAY